MVTQPGQGSLLSSAKERFRSEGRGTRLAAHGIRTTQPPVHTAAPACAAAQAMTKQLPRLSSTWMQPLDNTAWLLLKLQDLWPMEGGASAGPEM